MPKKHTPSNKVRKRRGKDVDEILEALAGGAGEQKRARLAAAYDDDLPGGGQHYCVQCDRHFVDAPTLAKHSVGKAHKQQLKRLTEPAYTQAEADAAGGLGVSSTG